MIAKRMLIAVAVADDVRQPHDRAAIEFPQQAPSNQQLAQQPSAESARSAATPMSLPSIPTGIASH
jgi:hypothetical protein